jgi:hypothetical protein
MVDVAKLCRVKVGQAPADMAPWRHNGCHCKSVYGTDTKILLTLAEQNQNYVFAGVQKKMEKVLQNFRWVSSPSVCSTPCVRIPYNGKIKGYA